MLSRINLHFLILAVVGGSAQGLAFHSIWFLPLTFIAQYPLIKRLYDGNSNLSISLIGVYLWSCCTCLIGISWLFHAFISGPLVACLVYPLFFVIIYSIALKIGNKSPKLALYFWASGWVVIEYFQLNWPFHFTLLGLGNAFGQVPWLIQWVEFTGVLGLSVWVLAVNIFIFYFFKKSKSIGLALAITLPPILSLVLYCYYNQNDAKRTYTHLGLMHTNLDCRKDRKIQNDLWKAKYYINLLNKYPPSKETRLLVFPELAFLGNENLEQFPTWSLQSILDSGLFRDHAEVQILVGSNAFTWAFDTITSLKKGYILNRNAQRYPFINLSLAILINKKGVEYFRAKEKLVPVEETYPFPKYLRHGLTLFPSLGQFKYSIPFRQSKTNFLTSGFGFFPLICYETCFGQFVAKRASKADFLVAIFNEGWYKNELGAVLMQNISRIRCIENRKWMGRSSNDGISSFINHRGEIVNQFLSYSPNVLYGQVELRRQSTFYATFGDWTGILAIIILVTSFSAYVIKPKDIVS